MAVFEAETINALDFFHRVFGAPPGAPEKGWMSPGKRFRTISGKGPGEDGLFFKTPPRRPLEALYLTLCFSEEISRLVFPRLPALSYPDLGLSLEAVRVAVQDRPFRVPSLWNFSVAWIEAHVETAGEDDILFPDRPPFYGIFFMGITQCAALMAHRHETPASLSRATASVVRTLCRRRDGAGMSALDAEAERVFQSELAGGRGAWPETTEALYRRAFQLGLDLMMDGLSGGCPAEADVFDRLDHLKTAVWRGLFDAAAPSEGPAAGKHDARILEVLSGVMRRWRPDHAGPGDSPFPDRQGPPGPSRSDDEDPDRTVVLDGPAVAAPPPEPEAAAPGVDAMPETVVLGGPGSGAPLSFDGPDVSPGNASRREAREPAATAPDAFPETVILSRPPGPPADGGAGATLSPAKASDASDDFPETLVIPHGKGRPSEHREGRPADVDAPPSPSVPEDGLDETVVIAKAGGPPPPPPGRPGDPRGKTPPGEEDDGSDDIILETVIIRPGSFHENPGESER